MIAWQPPTRFPFHPAPRLQLNHAQLVGPQTLSLIRGLIIDSLCPDLANKSLWRLLTPSPRVASPIFSISTTSSTLSSAAHSPSFPYPEVQWQRFQACFSLKLTVWATPYSFFSPPYSPWRMKNNLAAKARQAACGCPCPTRLRIHSIWARKEWIKINDGHIFIASL